MSVQVKGSGTIGGLDEGLVVSGIVTSSTQINVGSNIKLGNAGIITATSFVGSGANLTSLPSQVTINNASANRVFTSEGGTTFNGESGFTFNGSLASIINSSGPTLELTTNTNAADASLRLHEGTTGSTTNGGGMFYSGADNKLHITCGTNSTTKRITITRDAGIVGINTDSPSAAWLDIATDIGNYDHLRMRRLSSDSNVASNWSMKPYGGHLYFREGGSTDKIQFMNGGDFYILDGNLRVASGHGIDFAATADTGATGASSSSELLDDYEEGSFTPYIDRQHGSPIVGYDAQDGYYTKIGRVVYFYAEVRINSYNGNGSYGNTFLRGLPYNSAARTGGRGVWNSVTYHSYYRDIDTTDGERDIAVVQGNSEKVVFYVMRSESSWTAPPAPDGNDQFKIGGFYFT